MLKRLLTRQYRELFLNLSVHESFAALTKGVTQQFFSVPKTSQTAFGAIARFLIRLLFPTFFVAPASVADHKSNFYSTSLHSLFERLTASYCSIIFIVLMGFLNSVDDNSQAYGNFVVFFKLQGYSSIFLATE